MRLTYHNRLNPPPKSLRGVDKCCFVVTSKSAEEAHFCIYDYNVSCWARYRLLPTATPPNKKIVHKVNTLVLRKRFCIWLLLLGMGFARGLYIVGIGHQELATYGWANRLKDYFRVTTRPESSDPLCSGERRNPGCHTHEVPVAGRYPT